MKSAAGAVVPTPEEAHVATMREASGILSAEQPLPAYDDLKRLIKNLKGLQEYGTARKLITLGMKGNSGNVWLTQQLALCTYKDEEILPSKRFADALEILETIGLGNPGNVDPKTIPETLALGGAVYKRMFEYSGVLDNLYSSLSLYRAAWDWDPAVDMGYGGVNAAYVLDLLTSRLKRIGAADGEVLPEAKRLSDEAQLLRKQMAVRVTKAGRKDRSLQNEYWYAATLAEIHFGLRNYREAGNWLSRAKSLPADEWQRQTTFRQLVSLARWQGHIPPQDGTKPSQWKEPWTTLARFFDNGAERAFSCWRGKVGLALSGGGFRASFFHLGVMARLAEMDVLRSVEVLSTVSGGSILGAQYYLEVQNALTTRTDDELTRGVYVDIVSRVQERFLRSVQRNLRMRALTNLLCNLRMMLPRGFGLKAYTRSHRMGELYESEIYSGVDDGHPADRPRPMSGLLINPAGEADPPHFKPKFSNWRRRAKVPVLLLNTTSLNSGHNWQFTASWMGETPGLVGGEVDANARYRRLYYRQAPLAGLREYRLGYAVAASACVPGLFDPLEIRGLYPGRTVRLVDGGVHDNQGVEGLLDESCTFILCSDASGQMNDVASPSDGLLGVPLRSNSILMDRVREAEYQDLRERTENYSLQGLFFIHLKEDLVPAALDWIDCQDPRKEPAQMNTTSYGIDRDIQQKLAAIRTDLDSFTEVEASALMLSGYLMTEKKFLSLDEEYRKWNGVGKWGGFDVNAPRGTWPFLKLEGISAKPEDSSDLRRHDLGKQLGVGASRAFKVWRLSHGLQILGTAVLLAVAGSLVTLVYRSWDVNVGFGPWSLGTIIIWILILGAGLLYPTLQFLSPQSAMKTWAVKLALGILGWVASNIHLRLFDPVFLRRGKLDRLFRLPPD